MILETNQAVLEILKELHKENEAIMAAIKNKPWWETLLPLFFTIIGLAIGFLTQYFFFIRTTKKEIAKDKRMLYAQFAYHSRDYIHEYGKISDKEIKLQMFQKIADAYLKKSKEDSNEATRFLAKAKANNYIKEIDLLLLQNDKDIETFKTAKFNCMKVLNELQFILNNNQFDKLMNVYEGVGVYSLEDTFPLVELEDINFIPSIRAQKIDPAMDTLEQAQYHILDHVQNKS